MPILTPGNPSEWKVNISPSLTVGGVTGVSNQGELNRLVVAGLNTGIQTITGMQGATGKTGATGALGITGLQGSTGPIAALPSDTPGFVALFTGAGLGVSNFFQNETGYMGLGITGPMASLHIVNNNNDAQLITENIGAAFDTVNILKTVVPDGDAQGNSYHTYINGLAEAPLSVGQAGDDLSYRIIRAANMDGDATLVDVFRIEGYDGAIFPGRIPDDVGILRSLFVAGSGYVTGLQANSLINDTDRMVLSKPNGEVALSRMYETGASFTVLDRGLTGIPTTFLVRNTYTASDSDVANANITIETLAPVDETSSEPSLTLRSVSGEGGMKINSVGQTVISHGAVENLKLDDTNATFTDNVIPYSASDPTFNLGGPSTAARWNTAYLFTGGVNFYPLSSDPTNMTIYSRGSYTGILNGVAVTGIGYFGEVMFQRTGDVATLSIPTLIGVSDADTLTINGLPSHLRPPSGNQEIPIPAVFDNGATKAPAKAVVNSDGSIGLLFFDGSSYTDTYTIPGSKGLTQTNITYVIPQV